MTRGHDTLGVGHGSGCHYYHIGPLVRAHSAAPPPVLEYDAWVAAHTVSPKEGGRKIRLDGRTLRRVVVMRRNGCTFKEIGGSIGASANIARRWLAALPPELAA